MARSKLSLLPRYPAMRAGDPLRAWPRASTQPHSEAYSASAWPSIASTSTEPFMSRIWRTYTS